MFSDSECTIWRLKFQKKILRVLDRKGQPLPASTPSMAFGHGQTSMQHASLVLKTFRRTLILIIALINC